MELWEVAVLPVRCQPFWGLLIPIPAFSESLCMRQILGGQFPALLEIQTFYILSGCFPLLLGVFPSLVPELHLAHTSVVAQGLKCPQGQGSDSQAALSGLVKPRLVSQHCRVL